MENLRYLGIHCEGLGEILLVLRIHGVTIYVDMVHE